MTDNPNLLKKFYNIIDSEKRRAQDANNGQTDVETVAKRVRRLCAPFFTDLLALLGRLYFNILIGRRMKRGVKGFRKCSGSKKGGAASFNPRPPDPEQYLFEGMEEFRGYPEQLTYEDKPGHVVYVNSPKSRKYDRRKGAEYLELLHERDKQRIRIVRTGNRRADQMEAVYGDLPLEELVRLWKRDHREAVGQKGNG